MAYWGHDPIWQSLSGPQRAAAMALLEAETGRQGINIGNARNALGAIINRSIAENQPLEDHVSRKIYQPIIEDNQRARLQNILQMPEFAQFSDLASQRLTGAVPDWVNGADHYLAPPQTMLALEAKEPDKYKTWRKWSQFDPQTGQYGNVVATDNSHHFLKLLGDKPATAPPQLMASAAPLPGSPTPSQPPATKRQDAVIPFLMELLAGSMGTGAALGAGAGAAPAGANPLGIGMGGGATPAAGGTPMAPMDANGGMLSNLFGGGGGGGENPDPAAAAQAAAGKGGMQPLARQPIDMSKLAAMIKARPMLGFRGPMGGGMGGPMMGGGGPMA